MKKYLIVFIFFINPIKAQNISNNPNIYEGNENDAIDSTLITKKEYKIKVQKILKDIDFKCSIYENDTLLILNHLNNRLNLIDEKIDGKNKNFIADLQEIVKTVDIKQKEQKTTILIDKYNIRSLQNEKFDFININSENIESKIKQINSFYSILKSAFCNIERIAHNSTKIYIINKCAIEY